MRKTPLFLLCVLLSVNSFADGMITQNIVGGCNADNLVSADNKAFTIWQLNSYTCAPGYFLPANGIECVKCSIDHTCSGETYTFNENISQGIMFNAIITTDFAGGCVNDYLFPVNNNSNMMAIWKRNSYDCSAGYYLPADGVECVICPNNNYCPGGKYEYSETVPQGIMECPNNLFSPSGVFEVESCVRKLHIGDEILYLRGSKKTTHSLNIDINNDGIADFFGNATLQRTTINSTSQRYLHVGEYYIYDDSIRLEE